MLRPIVIAAMFALTMPISAVAQGMTPQEHRPAAGPPARGAPHFTPAPHPGGPPPGARTLAPPHGPPGPIARPLPGPIAGPHLGGTVGAQFNYRGRAFDRVHLAPFRYPPGFAYQRWAVGAVLPPLFLMPAYYYTDWATLGFDAPPPGTEWVRYGPDLLLVDLDTGQVVDVVYGVFY